MAENRVVVSVLVHNKQGALVRVSNVFTRRALNIIQITAAENPNPETTRITIVVKDEDGQLDCQQLDKQLRKIEHVIDAVILPYSETISNELVLIKIKYNQDSLKQIQEKLFEYSGKILSFDSEIVIGEVVGSYKQLNKFVTEISIFEVIELSRSGSTSLGLKDKTFI